ncbi:hypothetical protein [Halovivax cerinus]|uniref:Uncharacterized protein n=1 Tax=Halovivax cerinus TaxID=1487865 RepID=A0ABD5NNC2_9EURY|nr:hypothetical protein [Halovivax cerinus]
MHDTTRSRVQFLGSVSITAVGVGMADGLAPSLRTLFALALLAGGAAGISNLAANTSVADLSNAVRRRWIVAFVAFVPYGLATAPDSEAAAALGARLAGSVGLVALEAIAGALVLTAITTTLLYGVARYGLHPSAPTPEERVLDEPLDD